MIGRTNPHARRLRRDSTDAERLLWSHLRARRLNGLKFRRQVTIGPFIVDLAGIERRLIVEADGGQHSDVRDAARSAWLKDRGYRIERFWNDDILQNPDGVLQTILMAAKEQETPSPQLSPASQEREL